MLAYMVKSQVINYDDMCTTRKNDVCFSSAALVTLANEMLERLHVDVRVRSCVDMNSVLFVTLYEGLWAEPVKGKQCCELAYCFELVLNIFHVIAEGSH